MSKHVKIPKSEWVKMRNVLKSLVYAGYNLNIEETLCKMHFIFI